jgi:hypothetical protein
MSSLLCIVEQMSVGQMVFDQKTRDYHGKNFKKSKMSFFTSAVAIDAKTRDC